MIPHSSLRFQRFRRHCHWLLIIALWLNLISQLILPATPVRAAATMSTAATGPVRVAYLHGGDTASAQSFADLLTANGFTVQTFGFGGAPTEQPFQLMLPLVIRSGAGGAEVTTPQQIGALPNFAAFDLIIVSADSGAGDQWQPEAGLFEAVRDAGLPVIALGAGGHAFLGKLGLPIGHPHGSSSTTTAVQVGDLGASQSLYKGMTLPGDNLLPLYTGAQNVIAPPLAEAPVDGARLAALPGGAQLYPIAKAGHYFFWGLDGAPAVMTDTGKQLFLNLAHFATEKVEIQLRARTFTPTPGLDAALVTALQGSSGLHAFAQLTRQPNAEERQALSAIGITLVSFVGDTLYTAFVTPTPDANHPTFQGLVRWLGPIQPTDKIDPKIGAGQFESWADNGDGTVKLLIHFHEDVTPDAAVAQLNQLGIAHQPFSEDVYAANVAKSAIPQVAALDGVRWIEEGPLPNLPENDSTRVEMNVDAAQAASINGGSIFYAGVDGSGVKVAVFDSGINADNSPGNGHNDFAGRLLRTVNDSGGHGTHVAGIIGASGANSVSNCPFVSCTAFQMRGMAPGVRLAPYSNRDAASFDEAVNTYGVEISNSSQYQTCGSYDAHAQLLDRFIRGDGMNGGTAVPAHQMVKSAGNSGTSGQYCDAAGYFAVTGSAKNLLMVGALDAQNNLNLQSSSSRGPTWDGRLKPDVMGIGCGDSTDNDSQGYVSKCGTSMAAPAVTGILALMTEQYHHSFGAGRPRPSTLRAVVVQNATDLIHDPAQPGFAEYGWNDPDSGQPVIYHAGPDWATGYGIANGQRAVAAIRAHNFVEGTVSPGDAQDTYVINVTAGTPELKFTLVWDDEPGNPMLAVTAAQLVNNLDLTLEGPGGVVIRPWVLAPLPASSDLPGGDADPIVRNTHITAATRNVDNLNNTEQVQVANPAAGAWTIRINAASLPNGNAQPYSLAGDFRSLNIVSPQTGNVAEAGDPANPNVVPVVVEAVRSIDSTTSALSDATAGDFTVQIGGTAATIVNGAPVGDQFWLMVRPAAGTYSAGSKYDLSVTWNGHGSDSETRAILFTEREITDRAVVIDHSGSMADYDKMAAAQNAARLFIDQSLADDRIAVVSFSTNSTVDYPTTLVPTLGPAAVLDAAKATVNSLTPDGMTAIGKGLLDGQGQVTAAPADHSVADVVILLSDGMENVDPLYHTPAVEGVIEPSDTIVHTVAVGPASAGFHSLLDEIANSNGGQFRAVNEDGAGLVMAADANAATANPDFGIDAWPQTLPNRLGDVYKQYAEEILNESRLFQARGVGNPASTGAPQTFTVNVPEGLSRINFSFNWAQPNPNSFFQVVDPKQNVYYYKVGDPANKNCRGDDTHIVCIIEAPLAGAWTMSLRVGGEANEWALWVSARAAVSFHLWVGTPDRERVMGEPVHLLGFLGQGEKGLAGQSIKLNIFYPGGGSRPLELFDDGGHGDGAKEDGLYGNFFGEGTVPGAYAVRGMAQGQDLLNQPYTLFKNTGFHLRPKVLYVHKGDLDTANAYRQLIQNNGVAVDQLTMAQLPTADLRPYSLVIVAPETGSLSEWGDDAMVRRIIEFKKPVLGLGNGGYAFFGKLKLAIGWGNGAHGTGDSVLRENFNDQFWHYPYDFLVAEQRIWQLYSEPSPRVGIFLGNQPTGVQVFGYNNAQGQYADLIMENGRYLLWGFDKGPKSMTEDGRKLLVNAVYRTMQ